MIPPKFGRDLFEAFVLPSLVVVGLLAIVAIVRHCLAH